MCKTKSELVAEYALRSSTSPIGVSEYRLVESLPKDLEAGLPSIARIEEELSKLPAPRPSRLAKKTAANKQAPSAEAADDATFDGYRARDLMLTSLEIENFKGIAARPRMEFAPLTLLLVPTRDSDVLVCILEPARAIRADGRP